MPGNSSVADADYGQAVKSVYDQAWTLPANIANDNENIIVNVIIASDGTVISARIITPSGDANVDASVQIHWSASSSSLLLCTLLCAGLIEYDGNRVPVWLFVPALVVGITLPWAADRLVPIPVQIERTFPGNGLGVGVWSVLGLLAFVGFASWKWHNHQSTGLVLSLASVALIAGWLAFVNVAIIAAVCYGLLWFLRRFWPAVAIPGSLLVGVSTLVCILGWAGLVSS